MLFSMAFENRLTYLMVFCLMRSTKALSLAVLSDMIRSVIDLLEELLHIV